MTRLTPAVALSAYAIGQILSGLVLTTTIEPDLLGVFSVVIAIGMFWAGFAMLIWLAVLFAIWLINR